MFLTETRNMQKTYITYQSIAAWKNSIKHKYNNNAYTSRYTKEINEALIIHSYVHVCAHRPKPMENKSKVFPIMYKPSYKASIDIYVTRVLNKIYIYKSHTI